MLRRWPVAVFFLLALLLSWAAWIPHALAATGRIGVTVPAELIWLAEYGPSVAALVLTGLLGGAAAVRALLGRVVRWRVGARWYLIAILIVPATALLVVAVAAIAGRPVPDLAAFGAWQQRFVDRTDSFEPSIGLIDGLVSFMRTGSLATGLVFVVLAISNGGISEEIGWRGFALPWLQRRHSALVSTVMVTVLWALWHTDTNFWQVILGRDALGGLRFAAGYLGQYLVLMAPLTVLYAWVVNSTGSLLLAILLHASYNMTIIVATAGWREFPIFWLVGLLWIIAAVVVWRTGPTTLGAPSPGAGADGVSVPLPGDLPGAGGRAG